MGAASRTTTWTCVIGRVAQRPGASSAPRRPASTPECPTRVLSQAGPAVCGGPRRLPELAADRSGHSPQENADARTSLAEGCTLDQTGGPHCNECCFHSAPPLLADSPFPWGGVPLVLGILSPEVAWQSPVDDKVHLRGRVCWVGRGRSSWSLEGVGEAGWLRAGRRSRVNNSLCRKDV